MNLNATEVMSEEKMDSISQVDVREYCQSTLNEAVAHYEKNAADNRGVLTFVESILNDPTFTKATNSERVKMAKLFQQAWGLVAHAIQEETKKALQTQPEANPVEEPQPQAQQDQVTEPVAQPAPQPQPQPEPQPQAQEAPKATPAPTRPPAPQVNEDVNIAVGSNGSIKV